MVELDAYEKECRQQEREEDDKDVDDVGLDDSGNTIPLIPHDQQGTDQEEVEARPQSEPEEE